MLSFMSTTFRSMFDGEFREKNMPEVPVKVDGFDADHFESFLQCLYPGGSEPNGRCFRDNCYPENFSRRKKILNACWTDA